MSDQQMLIDYVPGEECRIAVIEDGKLDEYYHERASNESHVSNIYQGVVTNVEPSISAAFVDFGLERNGFLHITDVHPKYFPGEDREAFEKVGHKTRHGDRPGIEKCFKKGDSVTVQVLKEGIGNKGPTVTSYLSIPGRFLVMMPDMQQLGVSRKVDDDEQRREMKQLLKSLDPPKEFGFIMRTAGLGQSKVDLKKDLSYLVRLWKDIEERVAEGGATTAGRGRKKKGRRRARVTRELYTESDLVIRTIRDVFTSDVRRVVINHPEAAKRAHDFLAVSNPRAKSKVVFYDDPVPLFHRFGLEQQIDNIGSRTVELPSGGALVIDPTEALVAVDVNSGRSRSAKTSESNAFETNKEAVDEVARQLRLRDLGGLVVLDLIDMYQQRHRRAIEARLKKNFLRDKARTRVGGISQFGMLELTRQRMRGSLTESVHQECAHCGGNGHTKSVESVVLNVMRQLAMVMQQPSVARLELTISPDVAFHMLNRKRAELVALEARWQKAVTVRVGGGSVDYVQVTPLSEQGATLAPTAASGIPPETGDTFRDVSTLEDTDVEAWAAPVELPLEDPVVLGGHAEAGGIDDAAEPAATAPRRSGRHAADAGSEVDDAGADDTRSQDRDGADAEQTDSPRRRRKRRSRNRGREDEAPGSGESNDDDRSSHQEEHRTRPPEPRPAPRGPHLDPVLDFEFDPEAHPLDRARAYAELRLSTGVGDGPLPPAGEAARAREAVTETASVPLESAAEDASGVVDVAARVEPQPSESSTEHSSGTGSSGGEAEAAEADAADPPKRKRRRRRRGRRDRGDSEDATTADAEPRDDDQRPRDEHGDIDGNVREQAVPADSPGRSGAGPQDDQEVDDTAARNTEPGEPDSRGGKRKRSSGRRSPRESGEDVATNEPEDAEARDETEGGPAEGRTSKRKPRSKRASPAADDAEAAGDATREAAQPGSRRKPTSGSATKARRNKKPAAKPAAGGQPEGEPAAAGEAEVTGDADGSPPVKKKRRSRRKPEPPRVDSADHASAGDGSA